MENMGKASTKYLKEALGIIDDEVKEMQKEKKEKIMKVINEILNEDEEIKNKKHIKRIK